MQRDVRVGQAETLPYTGSSHAAIACKQMLWSAGSIARGKERGLMGSAALFEEGAKRKGELREGI